MMQFNNFNEMIRWITAKEREHTAIIGTSLEYGQGMSHEDALRIAAGEDHTEYVLQRLRDEGYNPDDLTANGDLYEYGGHTNANIYGRDDRNANITIQTLRQQYGLTQQALADATGIPKRTLENWEQGRACPKDYIVNMIAKFLENLAETGKLN